MAQDIQKKSLKGNYKKLVINKDNIDSIFTEKFFTVVRRNIYSFNWKISKFDREDVVQTAALRVYKSLRHKIKQLEEGNPEYIEKFYGKDYKGEVFPELSTTEGLFYSFVKTVCFNCVLVYQKQIKDKNNMFLNIDSVENDDPNNFVDMVGYSTSKSGIMPSYKQKLLNAVDDRAIVDNYFMMHRIKALLDDNEFDVLNCILENRNYVNVRKEKNIDQKSFNHILNNIRKKLKNEDFYLMEYENGSTKKTNRK